MQMFTRLHSFMFNQTELHGNKQVVSKVQSMEKAKDGHTMPLLSTNTWVHFEAQHSRQLSKFKSVTQRVDRWLKPVPTFLQYPIRVGVYVKFSEKVGNFNHVNYYYKYTNPTKNKINLLRLRPDTVFLQTCG